MPDTVKNIAQLILKYWRQELEEEELNELLDWANQSALNREAFARLTNPDFLVSNLRDLSVVKQEMRDRIWAELSVAGLVPKPDTIPEMDKRNLPELLHRYRKWLSAAAILLLTGLLACWFLQPKKEVPAGLEITKTSQGQHPDTAFAVQPSGIIQLADGARLLTDTFRTGIPVSIGALTIIKDTGWLRISVTPGVTPADSNSFATFITSVGGESKLSLPDGTEVWLNAASSLKLPMAFGVGNRIVEVTGEAWFYVQERIGSNRKLPFRVHTARMEMEVLGTKFNVNVYPEEKFATATLEKGSLRVWKQVAMPGNEVPENTLVDVVLRPGLQAQVSNSTEPGSDMWGIRVEPVNLTEALGWKTDKNTV